MSRLSLLVIALSAAMLLLILRSAPTPPPTSAAVGSLGRGPTVVLVHGLGSDANRWLGVARDLARDHRVVLVELPGHGLSPMVSPFSLERAHAVNAFPTLVIVGTNGRAVERIEGYPGADRLVQWITRAAMKERLSTRGGTGFGMP